MNPADLPYGKLLYSAQEARKILGIGEKAFEALAIDYIRVGKTKKYTYEILKEFIESRRVTLCQSVKGKARRSTSTISRSEEPGFVEARKQRIMERRKQSKSTYAPKLSLIQSQERNPQ